MKKILVTAVLASVLTVSAFAQGTISFSASGKIKYSADGTTVTGNVAAGSPATVLGASGGTLNIGFYSAASGTALQLDSSSVPIFNASWTQAAQVLHNVVPTAGSIPLTTITLGSGTPGNATQVEVVAWAGNYASFNAAYAAGSMIAWCGSALSGGSLGWTQGTGDPNGTPAIAQVPVPTGAAGFNTLVLQTVPEPGTLALAGLGAASLLLFRRRK